MGGGFEGAVFQSGDRPRAENLLVDGQIDQDVLLPVYSPVPRSGVSNPCFSNIDRSSSENDCVLWCSSWFLMSSLVLSRCEALTENAPYPFCHENLE